MATLLIFQLIVLLFSIMIHEISHGAVALYLGDDTAKRLGRLTLNPLKHLDPFGSIIVPLILAIPILLGGSSIIIGWAKPVPYNPYNLADPKKGAAIIGAAGPISNIFLATVFALLLHLPVTFGIGGEMLMTAFSIIVLLNILLAVFNLVPFPPLDGSKILFAFLPHSAAHIQATLERYGFFFIIFFILFLLPVLQAVVFFVFNILLLLVGIGPNLPI
ncbi:MAG: site-2 protease family protein [Patescibacteria group bacterium]